MNDIKTNNKTLACRLPSELKDQFEESCAAQGKVPSAELRAMLEAYLMWNHPMKHDIIEMCDDLGRPVELRDATFKSQWCCVECGRSCDCNS